LPGIARQICLGGCKKEKREGVVMKKRIEKELVVPVSAMIDVVFLLLVYFILTTTKIVDEASVAVNLPGEGTIDIEPKMTVDVYVYDGRYEILGSVYTLKELTRYFSGVAKASPDANVNVKVSTDASHKELVLVLDRLNAAKLNKFSLHTLK
jgi:biopolymer transport protein ExbD